MAIAVCSTGCTTTRSMPLERNDANQLHPSMPHAVHGVPLTIRVPTHVDVYIYEKIYFQQIDGALRQVPLKRPAVWVDLQTIETDQVVTVDWKRPFSGTLAYSAKFGSDQYFDALGATITDTTIQDVTAAVEAVAAFPTFASAKQPNWLEDDRLVAYRRFDLDACDVEASVVEFVQSHLFGAASWGSDWVVESTEATSPLPPPLPSSAPSNQLDRSRK
jgi:hypothetical protein